MKSRFCTMLVMVGAATGAVGFVACMGEDPVSAAPDAAPASDTGPEPPNDGAIRIDGATPSPDGALEDVVSPDGAPGVPFPSTGSEGPFEPAANVTSRPGVHTYTTIAIPAGVVVHVNGTGVLDLRATGAVKIDGTIDLSGADGRGVAASFGNGGGRQSGRTRGRWAVRRLPGRGQGRRRRCRRAGRRRCVRRQSRLARRSKWWRSWRRLSRLRRWRWWIRGRSGRRQLALDRGRGRV